MKRRNYSAGLALSLLGITMLAGCGEKETGSVMSSAQATGDTKSIRFKTTDGWMVFGDMYEPAGTPKGVVVLLHQRGGSADDWHALGAALKTAGYTVLAIDQRGTGRSTEGPGSTGEMAPWDTAKDIEGAVYSLKDKGPVALIGASYGANNALRYAAANPKLIRSLVLFSPSTDYHGVRTTEAVKEYAGPLLMFHDSGDKIAGTGPAILDKASVSKDHALVVNEGTGHGVALLNADTTQQTVKFLARTLK
jgi:pimeloyl-ACP methyl ester carboxylesterase